LTSQLIGGIEPYPFDAQQVERRASAGAAASNDVKPINAAEVIDVNVFMFVLKVKL